MRLFENIRKEQQAAYTEAGIGNPIPRPANAYFSNFRYHNGVTFLDPFQSQKDFQGDLQAIFIKPMTCYLLSWYHAGRAFYELGLTLVHLLTFSRETGIHSEKMIDSFVKSCVYDLMYYAELYSQALSFAMRCSISVGTGVYNIAEGMTNLVTQASKKPTDEPTPAFTM